MAKKPQKPERDSTAREVDRLLRQLPGADPTLQSDPDQPPPSAQGPPRAQMLPPRPAPPPRPSGPTPVQRWGVWGRLVGAGLLGGALTQWPYPTACGWALYGYLAAVAALLLTAGWTAVAAWRFREAAAHIGALIVGFWGVVLAAEQVLPRVGYAADVRTWACVAPAPRRVAPVVPRPLPPAVADSAAAGDSATLPDSAGAGVADTSAAPR